MLGGCLVQLLGSCKPEPTSGGGGAWPAMVPGASGLKCLCAVLLCMASWEAVPNSKEAPFNKVSSTKLTCLDLQVDIFCSQLLPVK